MLAGLLVFLCVTGGAVGFASNEDVEAQQAEPPGPVWTRAAEAPEGRQTPAFEVWAEELQPWIDHFVN